MGTSGAYSGSGGKDGKAVRDGIQQYLDSLDGSPPTTPADGDKRPRIDPSAIQSTVNLIRPRTSTGSGGGGPGGGGGGHAAGGGGAGSRGGGGPQRSASRSARTAGRAAAAAYAYRTGDAATLARLGLDYDELRGLGDQYEILRRIVDMACSTPDSSIEDHEQRRVAAEVAEWVLEQEGDGYVPTPEEIVRQTIATIIAEAILVESGEMVNNHDQADIAEGDIRDAAEALANRAPLSVEGATEDQISKAVEDGIETLRSISKAGS